MMQVCAEEGGSSWARQSLHGLGHRGLGTVTSTKHFLCTGRLEHVNAFSQRKRPFSSVQSLGRVRLFVTAWTAVRPASLSLTNSWSLLKLMSMESMMPSNHLILCRPLLLPPSIFPSIRVFSNESVHHIR